ncbi:hypothetical protein QGN32_21425 [Mycolicibacterium sp. ND9-15]|uniref:hypothetical protein n=1 Tax=Mycolicibacterium sp. ND9-15 TaxID=3042320 RepID=UPI002DDAEAC4|nr:hypothetical protein [Mycolicibacterium sp. ND9-15]WSE55900.1 hypothetical protein QGN32_21425 [Mycolicibacterium sp. ND9-15]
MYTRWGWYRSGADVEDPAACWVDRGQVRGEVVESARGAGDGAAGMGGGEPVEVGHERVPQGGGGIPHTLGKALS